MSMASLALKLCGQVNIHRIVLFMRRQQTTIFLVKLVTLDPSLKAITNLSPLYESQISMHLSLKLAFKSGELKQMIAHCVSASTPRAFARTPCSSPRRQPRAPPAPLTAHGPAPCPTQTGPHAGSQAPISYNDAWLHGALMFLSPF